MARKRRSGLDGLIDIASRLPWWLSLMIALVGYLVLHSVAGMETVKPHGSQNLAAYMATTLVKMFAMLGQFIVPAAFVLGALASGIKSFSNRRLLEKASVNTDLVRSLSWQDFERLVGEVYRRKGFDVQEVGGGGADGGVDLIAIRNNERFLIQCKHWKALRVGVKPVRELYGVMAHEAAAGGALVTSGRFTAAAEKFASENAIELIDGLLLEHWLSEVRIPQHGHDGHDEAALSSAPLIIPEPIATETRLVAPSCPRCGSEMVQRVAKQGSMAGKSFWGCSRFPKCHGTRSVA